MPWWGWLLLGAGIVGVIAVVIWALTRKRGAAVDRKALFDSERKRLRAELEAERKGHEEVAQELLELAKEKKKIDEWYNKHCNEISAEAIDEYKRLASDPDALDRKLDQLLGINGPTDHSDPG